MLFDPLVDPCIQRRDDPALFLDLLFQVPDGSCLLLDPLTPTPRFSRSADNCQLSISSTRTLLLTGI